MENDSPKSCSACGSWWQLPVLLGLVLAAIVFARGCGVSETTVTKSKSNTDADSTSKSADADAFEVVSLTIDFGDGRKQEFDRIAWHEGMTITNMIGMVPEITVLQKDTGSSAFLTTINDVANEGEGGRNWTYSVNGKSGDRSFAVYELRPNDHVLWTFGPRQ